MVLRPCQRSIGYMGDGVCCLDDVWDDSDWLIWL